MPAVKPPVQAKKPPVPPPMLYLEGPMASELIKKGQLLQTFTLTAKAEIVGLSVNEFDGQKSVTLKLTKVETE